jgi:hypothetical protein
MGFEKNILAILLCYKIQTVSNTIAVNYKTF